MLKFSAHQRTNKKTRGLVSIGPRGCGSGWGLPNSGYEYDIWEKTRSGSDLWEKTGSGFDLWEINGIRIRPSRNERDPL